MPCGLDHYHHDVFSWLLKRNENVHRGIFPVVNPAFYLMKFESGDASTNADRLVWRHGPDVPGSDFFNKNPPTCGRMGQASVIAVGL